jgi:hypothetical protein
LFEEANLFTVALYKLFCKGRVKDAEHSYFSMGLKFVRERKVFFAGQEAD